MSTRTDAGRAFARLLANTFVANLTTSFLWFAVTFWIYLETRSVPATSVMGGSYLLLLAVMGVPFGMLVDRHPKKPVMVASQLVTAVAFVAAGVFLLAPPQQLLAVGSLSFWLFIGAVLVGLVMTGPALVSRPYRGLSRAYAAAPSAATGSAAEPTGA